MALSADGSVLAVARHRENSSMDIESAGAVYVFRGPRMSGAWSPRFIAPELAIADPLREHRWT